MTRDIASCSSDLDENFLKKINVAASEKDNIVQFRGILGNTALHFAVTLDYPLEFQKLLTLKADVNAVNVSKESVLHIAARYGKTQFIQFISAYNPLWNESNEAGMTPLQIATQAGYVQFVEALIPYVEKINVTCNDSFSLPVVHKKVSLKGEGLSALHIAINNQHAKIVRLLLKHPYIDTNLATDDGYTPFFLSVYQMAFDTPNRKNDIRCLRELLLAGCSIELDTLIEKFDANFIKHVRKIVNTIQQEIQNTQKNHCLLDITTAANLLRLEDDTLLKVVDQKIKIIQNKAMFLPVELWDQVRQYLLAIYLKEITIVSLKELVILPKPLDVTKESSLTTYCTYPKHSP